MMRLLFLLPLIFLAAFPTFTHADEARFEPLTPENARWLIPLVSAQVGSITEMMWMPGDESIALQMSTGVWVFPAEIVENEPVLVMEEGVFYPRLTNLTLNPDRTRLIALEIIPDMRPDQPTYAYVWDVSTGEIIAELVGVNEIEAVSLDGQTIAVSDGYRVLIYSLTSGQRTEVITAPRLVDHVGFSPDGRYLAVLGHDSVDYVGTINPYLMIYDLSRQEVITLLETDGWSWLGQGPLSFSTDNRTIVLGGNHIFEYWQFDPAAARLSYITPQAFELGYQANPDGFLVLPDGGRLKYNPAVNTNGQVLTFRRGESELSRIGEQLAVWHSLGAVNREPFVMAYLGVDEPMLGLLGLDEQVIGYRANESGIHLQMPSYTLPGFPKPFYTRYSLEGLRLVQYSVRPDDHVTFNIIAQSPEGYGLDVFTSPVFLEGGERLLYVYRGLYGWITTVLDLDSYTVFYQTGLMFNARLFDWGQSMVGAIQGGYTLYQSAKGPTGYENYYPMSWIVESDEIQSPLLAAIPNEPEFAVLAQGVMVRWRDGNFVDNGVYAEDLDLDELLPRTLVYSMDGRWLLALGHDGDGFGGVLWKYEYFGIFPYGSPIQPARFTLSGTPETGYETTVYDADLEVDVAISVTIDSDRRMRFNYADTGQQLAEFVLPPWEVWVDTTDKSSPIQTPDGALYTNNDDNLGYLYSRETGEVVGLIPSGFSIAFDPQGYTLSGGGQLWGVPASPADPNTVVCEGAPVPKLRVDSQAVITATTGPRSLRLRSAPNGTILDSLPSGSIVQIARGPICDRGAMWWGVETESGESGWVAEAVTPEDYLLLPTD